MCDTEPKILAITGIKSHLYTFEHTGVDWTRCDLRSNIYKQIPTPMHYSTGGDVKSHLPRS